MLAQAFWRPDVVLVVEPPLFCSFSALLTARLGRSKSWLHVQDFKVDAAFELGLMWSEALRSVVCSVEKLLMSGFSRMLMISEQMQARLRDKGVTNWLIVFFPNWVDMELIRPLGDVSPVRRVQGVAYDRIVLLYSRNMREK